MQNKQSIANLITGVLTTNAGYNVYHKSKQTLGDAGIWRGVGLDAGGRVLVSSGSADISITDGTGRVLYSGTTISASVDIDPSAAGIEGPLAVTITNQSSFGGRVYWKVKV